MAFLSLQKFIKSPYGIPMMLGVLYILLPTINSTSDAMGYATGSEIGPHHLLFDQICVWMNALCGFNPIKTLAAMKIINAVLGAATLFILFFILNRLEANHPWLWVLICGSSFGFMRFATENEAYILPLFFAALGLFALQIYFQKNFKKHLYWAFVILALAVTSHQSYVFFYAAVALYVVFTQGRNWRIWLAFLLPTAIVFLVYLLASHIQNQPLWLWIIKDANDGLVNLKPGIQNFIFTLLNLIRTFTQVHGNIPILLKTFPVLYPIAGLAVTGMALGLYFAIKSIKKQAGNTFPPIAKVASIAALLQLLFAWFSVGNAEFMVMLPLLLAIVLAASLAISPRSLWFIGLGMLGWNLAVSIIPSATIDFENREGLRKKLELHKPQYFISHNAVEYQNYLGLFVDTGYIIPCQLNRRLPYKVLKSPADKGKDFELPYSMKIVTDCIQYPEPTNRHSLVSGNINQAFFKQHKAVVIDSVLSFYGTIYLYQIE